MDAAQGSQVIDRMCSSFPHPVEYQIIYTLDSKLDPSYYSRYKRLLDKLNADSSKLLPQLNFPGLGSSPKEQLSAITTNLLDKLNRPKEMIFSYDYSRDSSGFVMQRDVTMTACDGSITKNKNVYCSNGQIMGTFDLDNSRAALQPATQRPPIPDQQWDDVAYLLEGNQLSDIFRNMQISTTQAEGKLIISGKQSTPTGITTCELQIDSGTLCPQVITVSNTNQLGVIVRKISKEWSFDNSLVLNLPVCVKQKEFIADDKGQLNLEKEETLSIHAFDVSPQSSKTSYDQLLQGNFRVFDSISATHYISGNPQQMLDQLLLKAK